MASINLPTYDQMASYIEQHIAQGDTLASLLTALETANELKEEELELKKTELAQQWVNAVGVENMTMADIAYIVRQGWAQNYFQIGDQITTTYTYSGTEYEDPWDVVSFETAELENGDEVPCMVIQQHFASIESVMFDGYEGFYYAESGLEAGTYYITVGSTAASNNWVSGGSWQFTLTEDVPEGGILAGFRLHRDSGKDISSLYVYSYDSSYNLIESVAVSSGSDGTSLGTVTLAGGDGLNADQRFGYGYNRWSQSAYRQWLNSDADTGSWWESQNDYDLPPDQLSSYAGFMQGLPDDFLAEIKATKVTTALNTVEGLEDTSEDTYDKFFLPSLEQEYIVPQLSGVEGDYWEYWRQVLGLTSPQKTGSGYANENHIRYAINSTSSARTVRARSANRGHATDVWYVDSTGFVGNGYGACHALCSAPACCIC